MSLNLEFWKPLVGETWFLNNQSLFNSPFAQGLLSKVNQEYQKGTIYPLQEDIFKAFRMTPFDKVKIVILGDEPFTTGPENEPDATGLAYANNPESMNMTISMQNIHKAIETTCYNGLNVSFDYSLEEWADQGVLLLNTALTVNKHKPGSHIVMWEGFTKYIVESLNKQTTGLHFVFWGKQVQRYAPLVNGLFHFKYEFEHPSKKGEWNCTHFNDINFNLIETNGYKDTIAW